VYPNPENRSYDNGKRENTIIKVVEIEIEIVKFGHSGKRKIK